MYPFDVRALYGVVRCAVEEPLRCSGSLAESRRSCWAAAAEAGAAGDTQGLARAALALGGIWVHEHRSSLDQARVESLQRAALAALDHEDLLARRLRARLAAEQSYLDGDPAPALAELDAARTRR